MNFQSSVFDFLRLTFPGRSVPTGPDYFWCLSAAVNNGHPPSPTLRRILQGIMPVPLVNFIQISPNTCLHSFA